MIHLDSSPANTFTLRTCEWKWPGSHTKAELRRNQEDIGQTLAWEDRELTPKERMWARICMDYTPSTHPSHAACAPPEGNKPTPAIWAAVKARHRLIFTTIPWLATGHCFDATYSERFRTGADNYTICPCKHIPHTSRVRGPRRACHTKEHMIFHCPRYTPSRLTHLEGLSSLPTILWSEEHTARLCAFLLETNSLLLRLLTKPQEVLRPSRDPT